ncbi:MAG: hemin uptake protein HemP [Planctomyces sp.]|nr:hemin uptake protein HemP [Planctomyces sp.]
MIEPSESPNLQPQPPVPSLPATAAASQGATSSSPSIDSGTLMQGQKELLIDHLGEVYRLRVTRNGKLILHK